MMTRSTPHLALCLWALVTAACNNTPTSPNYEDNGGSNSGGSATGGSGGSAGNSGSGGTSSTGGSTSAGGSGGNTATGGNTSTGGSSGSGGSFKGSGGTTMSSGGSSATGGSSTSGGSTGSGGATGSGGSSGAKDAGVPRDAGKGPEVGGGDATSAVSYKNQIQPLLQTNCASCHSGSTANAGIDVSTYANVSKNAKTINSAIQNGTMPLGSPLSAADKQLFQTWVNAGSPNN